MQATIPRTFRVGDFEVHLVEDALRWGGCQVYAATKWSEGWYDKKVVFTFCAPPGEKPWLAYALVSSARSRMRTPRGISVPRTIINHGKIYLDRADQREVIEKIREILSKKMYRRFFDPEFFFEAAQALELL